MSTSQNAVILFDGRAYSAELIVHASMPVSEALKGMDEMGETKFTFVPHGDISCAGFARFEDRRFYLMYFPPKRRQLIWRNKHNDERRQFVLWWPHVYLGIFFRGGSIEDGYAMASRKKLTSLQEKLCRLPLPNLGKKFGHICEGAKGMWNVMARPEESAYQYSDYFFKSEWLSDINDHWSFLPKDLYPAGWDFSKQIPSENQYEDLNQKILGVWEAISETDPRAVERIQWPEHFTIDDLVQAEWKGKMTIDGQSGITLEQIQSILGGQTGAAPVAGLTGLQGIVTFNNQNA
jgi:hypothetical protein